MTDLGQTCRSYAARVDSAHDLIAGELPKRAIERDGPKRHLCYSRFIVQAASYCGSAWGTSLQHKTKDIRYIATPHPHHVSAAKLALTAGKHILVEKPFTINAREAAEIVALAKAKNLMVLEAMWTRFLPHMRRIREIVAAGTIGEIRSLIAFAWDILGKPATNKASATFRATGADAQVATIFHYASGAIATTLSSSDSAGSNRASIVGTKGRIEIDHVWYSPTTFRVYDNSNAVTEAFDGAVEGRGMQFQADEAERRTGPFL